VASLSEIILSYIYRTEHGRAFVFKTALDLVSHLKVAYLIFVLSMLMTSYNEIILLEHFF
jgi:hypothetical protein